MAFQMTVSPVNLSEQVTLPNPWPTLEQSGFHQDLLDRAKGFMLQAKRLGFEEQAMDFLGRLGEGFMTPFKANSIIIADNDPDREFKVKALVALQELSDEFGDRVSSIVWQTFAFLATRPNPTGYATILSSKDHLPFPWWVADSVLHGVGKVYGFMLHIHTKMVQQSGVVFEHNCDCGCDVHGGGKGFDVSAPLRTGRHTLATAALMSHLMGECLLITGLGMPFEMGLSPEAAEAMAS